MNRERAAFAGRTLDFDAAAVRLRDVRDQRQSQSGSGDELALRREDTIEVLKNWRLAPRGQFPLRNQSLELPPDRFVFAVVDQSRDLHPNTSWRW